VSDEQVGNVDGFSANFGVKVETARLNAALLYHRLQQHAEEERWTPWDNDNTETI